MFWRTSTGHQQGENRLVPQNPREAQSWGTAYNKECVGRRWSCLRKSITLSRQRTPAPVSSPLRREVDWFFEKTLGLWGQYAQHGQELGIGVKIGEWTEHLHMEWSDSSKPFHPRCPPPPQIVGSLSDKTGFFAGETKHFPGKDGHVLAFRGSPMKGWFPTDRSKVKAVWNGSCEGSPALDFYCCCVKLSQT